MVNPCTAAISASSPFSIGASLTAFQYSPSTKILPLRESIGVKVVTVLPMSVSFPTFTGNSCARSPFPTTKMKNALGRRHLDFGQLRAGGVERFAVHNAPVQFLQQIGHIGRDQINDFQFQGFLRSDRSALLYGGLGPFNVALALARNGLHVADGKVFEFLLHGFVRFFFATAR